jgi:AraC family transcriptional regulator of arabinose operon
MNALEEVILWCDSINPARSEPQIDPRVRTAMDYLARHCHEPFSEGTLGREAGLSGSRLRHLFRSQTGLSPRAFQEEKRMDRARLLLAQSNQSIAEISWELGFENPFYFSLRFKKHSGQSPREFRNRALGSIQR